MGITTEYGVAPEEGESTQTEPSLQVEPHPLELKLDYRFKLPALLEEALTHPSQAHAARQRGEGIPDNQRLEFLGDAVLDLLVGERLFHVDPLAPPGLLTQRRIALVGEPTLARIGAELALDEALLVGVGERKQGLHKQVSVLADAVEAVLGAVYLDGGLEAARAVVERLYGAELNVLRASQELKNPKIQIQELSQGRWTITPTYTIHQVGRHFVAELRVGDKLQSSGKGPTRKQAELAAAEAALPLFAEVCVREDALASQAQEQALSAQAKAPRVAESPSEAPPKRTTFPPKEGKAKRAGRPPVEVVVLPRRPKPPSADTHSPPQSTPKARHPRGPKR